MDARQKWDAYYAQAEINEIIPLDLLSENRFLLPSKALALDLACGLGANALYLANLGYQVHAWDISKIALSKLQHFAAAQQLKLFTREINIDAEALKNQNFDIIVVCRFLDRALSNAIIDALNPGGLLFYQTYTLTKDQQIGPKNSDYLLQSQELLQLFKPLTTIFYRDNADVGDIRKGFRNEAQYIGQKL